MDGKEGIESVLLPPSWQFRNIARGARIVNKEEHIYFYLSAFTNEEQSIDDTTKRIYLYYHIGT